MAWLVVGLVLGAGATAVLAWARGQRRRAQTSVLTLVVVLVGAAALLRQDLALQKALSWALMPTGWLWLGQGSLALILWAKGLKPLALSSAALFLLTSILGNTWLSPRLMSTLEAQVDARNFDNTPPLEAVLVLGGGAWLDHRGQPMVADSGDRVVVAARLWHAGKVRQLVTSGSAIAAFGADQHLGEVTRTLWLQLGIQDDAILVLRGAHNTSQEIADFAQLARERGWSQVGVLSSVWHLPRIMALCEKHNLKVVPIGADRRGGEMAAHPALFVPRPEPWKWTQAYFWEHLGRWVGR